MFSVFSSLFFPQGDVGNYYYGQGHPMKPHRIRMTHNLLLNYGLYRRMEIYVSSGTQHLTADAQKSVVKNNQISYVYFFKKKIKKSVFRGHTKPAGKR